MSYLELHDGLSHRPTKVANVFTNASLNGSPKDVRANLLLSANPVHANIAQRNENSFKAPVNRMNPSTSLQLAAGPYSTGSSRPKRTHPSSNLIHSLSSADVAAAAAAGSMAPSIQPTSRSQPTSTTTYGQHLAAKRAAVATAVPVPTPPSLMPISQRIAFSNRMPSSYNAVATEVDIMTGHYGQPEMHIPKLNKNDTVVHHRHNSSSSSNTTETLTTSYNTLLNSATMSADGSTSEHPPNKKAKINGTFQVIEIISPDDENEHYHHESSSGFLPEIDPEEQRRQLEELVKQNMRELYQKHRNETRRKPKQVKQQVHQQWLPLPQEPPVTGDPNVPMLLTYPYHMRLTQSDAQQNKGQILMKIDNNFGNMLPQGRLGHSLNNRLSKYLEEDRLTLEERGRQLKLEQAEPRGWEKELLELQQIWLEQQQPKQQPSHGQQQNEHQNGHYQDLFEPQVKLEPAESLTHELAIEYNPNTSMQAAQAMPKPEPYQNQTKSSSAAASTSAARSKRVEHPKARPTLKPKVASELKPTPQRKPQQKANGHPKGSKSNLNQSAMRQPETEETKPTAPIKDLVAEAKGYDPFCWFCHNEIGDQANAQHCTKCVLSFHPDCAKKKKIFVKSAAVSKPNAKKKKCTNLPAAAAADPNEWNVKDLPLMKSNEAICFDCIQKEAGLEYNKVFGFKSNTYAANHDKMGKTFHYACHTLASKFPDFAEIDFTRFEHLILEKMDLNMMDEKTSRDYYQSKESFMYDIKLVIHNMNIIMTSKRVLSKCDELVTFARSEAKCIDLCDSCYRNYYEMNEPDEQLTDSRVMPCQYPHSLVWFKLRNQFWPAKVYEHRPEGTFQLDNDLVDVVPFGEETELPVTVRACSLYTYSKNPPREDPKACKRLKPIEQKDLEQNAQAFKDVEKYLELLSQYFDHKYVVPDEPERFNRDDIYMSDIHQKKFDENGRCPWEERQIRWGLED